MCNDDSDVSKHMLTWAATAMAVMKTPSTPKGVKKVCRLRVSLKGTGSLRSNTPLHIISMLCKDRKTETREGRKEGRKEGTMPSGISIQGRWRCSQLSRACFMGGCCHSHHAQHDDLISVSSQRLVACH